MVCVEMTELISHFIHCALWVHLFAPAAGAGSRDRTSLSSPDSIRATWEEPGSEGKSMSCVSHWQLLLALKRL